MKLARLLFGVEVRGASLGGFALERDIPAVCSDSRKVTAGCLFVCLHGTKDDGHDHAAEALGRGAVMIICERESALPPGSPYVLVGDTRQANSKIWNNFCGDPASRLRVTAVTGTNGKTTTACLLQKIYMIAGQSEDAALACRFSDTRLIGTLTGTLTTPDPEELYPLLAGYVSEGCDNIVMEASSHALALGKLDALTPEYALFTNLTSEHLDFHRTMDEYFAAKAKLFRMARLGIANADDAYFRRLAAAASCPVKSYSASGRDADYRAAGIIPHGTGGSEYTLVSPAGEFVIRTPLCGTFNVANTLAAAATALEAGITPEMVALGIASFDSVKGRFERVPTPGQDFDVFIDFAHTPDALTNIIKAVRGVINPGGRLTVLFGCGGDRDPYKRPVMGKIASSLADFTVITSDNSRSEKPVDIIAQILKGFDRERPHAVIENRREAIFLCA